MLRIETKPCVTVTTHKGTIDLDKSYEVSIDKVVTTEGHTYVIHSELEGIEKRIVEAAVLNEVTKNGIK